MGEIIELGDGRRAPSLGDQFATSRGAESLHRILDDRLLDAEEPSYWLTNGQRGIVLDDDERRELEPSANRLGHLILSDVRAVVVIDGASESDEITSVPYLELVAIRRESSFFTDRLVLSTPDTEIEIPFKGNLDAVESFMKDALSDWSGARTAIEAFRDRMATAFDHLDRGEFDAALDSADGAEAALLQARSRLEDRGDGALAYLDEVTGEDDIDRLRARVHRERGEQRYKRAMEAVDADELRQGYDALEAAKAAFQQAAETQTGRMDEEIGDWLSTVDEEINDLQSLPLDRARTAYQDALEHEDGMTRAIALQESLERYREALWTCWGDHGAPFDGETDALRDRIVEIVERIYEARTNVAWERLVDGDAYAEQGDPERARTHYEDARTQLDRVSDVTEELHPDLDDRLDTWFAAVDDRLDGIDGPPTVDHHDPVPEPTPDIDPLGTTPLDKPIETLDQAELIDVVAEMLSKHGWSTTTATGDDPYQVLATRHDPFELQGLVRVIADDDPRPEAVSRLADAAARTTGASVAIFVAVDASESVRDLAADRGVKLIDAERLATLLDPQSPAGESQHSIV